MNWYLEAFKKYATFSGRARRKEYWMFTLFNTIFLIILFCIDSIIASEIGIAGLSLIYGLAVFLPSLAVGVRRLHDIGYSGWWMLISFIPFGSIVLFVFSCLDSQPGDNQYGVYPK